MPDDRDQDVDQLADARHELDVLRALLAEVRPFLSQISYGELHPDLEQRAQELEQRIVDQVGDGDDPGDEDDRRQEA